MKRPVPCWQALCLVCRHGTQNQAGSDCGGCGVAGRVQAGKHYPSDLVLGLALGTVAGWVLPRALHYGFGDEGYYDTPRREAAESVSHQPVLVSIQPFVEESQGGVHVVGIW